MNKSFLKSLLRRVDIIIIAIKVLLLALNYGGELVRVCMLRDLSNF